MVGEKTCPEDFFWFYESLRGLCSRAVVPRGLMSLLYLAIRHLAAITPETFLIRPTKQM